MKKNRKIRFLCLIASLFFVLPYQVKAASLVFKALQSSGYLVSGSINENDLQWVDSGSFWAPLHTYVHEQGNNYYESLDKNTYCTKSKQESVNIINAKLSQGIWAARKVSYANDQPEWTAKLNCMAGPSASDGGWMFATMTPSPPNGAVCNTAVPLKVSFGTLTMGTNDAIAVMDGTIQCDRDADVALSFRGFEDGYIPVQDAKVKLTFDNGQPTYKLVTRKNVTTNFKVKFEAISTGTTTGYKSASAVLVMQWP